MKSALLKSSWSIWIAKDITASLLSLLVQRAELHSRFVRDKDVPRLKARNCGVFEAPFGEMLVLEKGLEIDDEVYFDLRSFFGVKDIATRGIRPFSF